MRLGRGSRQARIGSNETKFLKGNVMHDIKAMRADPQDYITGLTRRGMKDAKDAVTRVLALDKAVRDNQTAKQAKLAERNDKSRQIGEAMKAGDIQRANRLKAEVGEIKDWLNAYDLENDNIPAGLRAMEMEIPNLPAKDVPDGKDEKDNIELACHGTPRAVTVHHADFGPSLGMDFEAGTLLAGTRNTVLRGQMARLQRALGQFMLDVQTIEAGYEETAIPLLVKRDALEGTGQLPKFEEDLFVTTDDRWLIPTAEVGLTNLVRDQIVDLERPMRLTALTQCFRAEAGAAGRDTRGYIRQHQFEKVELVTICREEDAQAEHDRMLGDACCILDKLELPYRVVLLCAGDMGFAAKRTYDIEVWMPGQNAYREIASISWCGDFQGRRMNARYRDESGQTRFVHTLNGSGLAVGRALVAVLENNLQDDGTILIPEALRPYMGGMEAIA